MFDWYGTSTPCYLFAIKECRLGLQPPPLPRVSVLVERGFVLCNLRIVGRCGWKLCTGTASPAGARLDSSRNARLIGRMFWGLLSLV